MIPRSLIKPLYRFHRRIKLLVICLLVLIVLLITAMGLFVYTRSTPGAVSSPRLVSRADASGISGTTNNSVYDLEIVKSIYKEIISDKKFIGQGLYVVLWDKHSHTFYDVVTQNVDTPYNAASVTKLMTALTLAEEGVLGSEAVTGSSDTQPAGLPEGEATGDFRGQVFPQSDLVAAMLIQSSNQAAYSLTKPFGPDTFMEKMNKNARKLGMSRTVLRDPSGYDFGSRAQASYMSPRDVARVAFELVSQYPDMIELSSKSEMDIINTRGKTFTLHNTNPLVTKTSNVRLSKTGYTNLAGGNLAMVTEPRPGIMAAFVSLKSTKDGRVSDVSSLVQAMDTSFSLYDLTRKGR